MTFFADCIQLDWNNLLQVCRLNLELCLYLYTKGDCIINTKKRIVNINIQIQAQLFKGLHK